LRVRLNLLDGELRKAEAGSEYRAKRYDSDYARANQIGLLFMLGVPDKAWGIFMERAASTENLHIWFAALTSHRMQGMASDQVLPWFNDRKLDKAQIENIDVDRTFQHLMTVLDRLPDEQNIEKLGEGNPSTRYVSPVWQASAQLTRSAMTQSEHAKSQQMVKEALGQWNSSRKWSFMQPLYSWVTWLATDGKDPYMAEVREISTYSGLLDELLSKSMLLALEGNVIESLQIFNAARYRVAQETSRLIPPGYSLALAGILMHQKTGNEAYRTATLKFLRAQQIVFPYFSWTYSMEAFLETNENAKKAAACKAQHLDANSYFLSQANVKQLNASSCKAILKNWLK
jgi:hypothetical protein